MPKSPKASTSCAWERHGFAVPVGARKGDRAGKPDARPYRFTVHGGTAPARVLLDGRPADADS